MKEKIKVKSMPLLKSLDCMSICSFDRLLKYHKMPASMAVMLKSQPKRTGSKRRIFCLIETKIRPVMVAA